MKRKQSIHKRWKKHHDYKLMMRKVLFKKKRSLKLRNGRPKYQHILTTSNEKSVNYISVTAPANFSLIDNVEEVLEFIDDIRKHYQKSEPVYVMMENVSSLGDGAILLLLANMIQFRTHGISFNGSKPNEEVLRKKMDSSGFFAYLYKYTSKRDDYSVGTLDSSIYTHAQKNVDSVMSDQIVEKASMAVWETARRCPGVQRTLVELMQNTNNHAGRVKGEKHWWLSLNKDSVNQTATISFMDFGRGIFDSLDNKEPGDLFYGWKDKFFKVFPFANTSEQIMKLILQGELHRTCTGEYFRGKGLPGLYEAYQNGRIGKLKIISNNVYADIENDKYYLLNHNLHGTFVSCEINKTIYNLPW